MHPRYILHAYCRLRWRLIAQVALFQCCFIRTKLTSTDHCEAPDVLRAVGVEQVSLDAPLKSEDSTVDLHAQKEEVEKPLEEPKEEIEEVRDEHEDGVEHLTDDDVSSSRSSTRSSTRSSAHSSTRNEKHPEHPTAPAPVVHV